jgi:hypothetical protein
MCVAERKAFSSWLASDHFTLVPAMSMGRSLALRISRALRTSVRSGASRGGWVRIGGIRAASHSACPMKMSIGISRNAGPGIPDTAWRMASSVYSGMRWVW